MPGWRFTTRDLDQARFLLAIEKWRARRVLTFLALQGRLQPLLHNALTQPRHGSRGTRERLRGLLIAPIRTPRIDLQQHIGVLDLVRWTPTVGQLGTEN